MKAAIGVIVTATLLAGVSAPGRTQSLEGTLPPHRLIDQIGADEPIKRLAREQPLDATVHEVAVLAVGVDPFLKFRLVGNRNAAAIDMAGNPVTVIEAIFEFPFRVQGVPEDAPDDLGVAVGGDWHHRFPDRPIDRARLIEDHKNAPTSVMQTGERFRAVRIPR